ncbi:MAG: hypothetical protein IPJ71_03180 [Bdellovibrionales bacterium]|nr:hypothetical protein [Bdellovibrionales bacterium]
MGIGKSVGGIMELGNLKKWNRAAVAILILSFSIPSGVSSGGPLTKGSQVSSPGNSLQLMEYEQLMSLSKEDLGLYLTGIKLMLVDWEKSQAAHHPELVAGNTSEQLKFLDRAFSILVAESVWAKTNPPGLSAAAPASTPATAPSPAAVPAAVKPPPINSAPEKTPAAKAPITPQSCIYAGWISTTDSKGYCQRPKACEGDASKNSVQCNPLLFGNGVCVSVENMEVRNKATLNCFERTKSNQIVAEEIKQSASDWKKFNETFKESTAPCNRTDAPPYCKSLSKRLRELNALLPQSVAVKEPKSGPPAVSKSPAVAKTDAVRGAAKAGKATVERRDRLAERRGARTRSAGGPTRRAVARDTGEDGESDDDAPSDEELPDETIPEVADGDGARPSAARPGRGETLEKHALRDEGVSQYGKGKCRPHALDFDAAFPGSEEPSPVLSFEEAQDLICKSKFDQNLVNSRLEFLRRQIASFNTKSRAETDYYHRLWTQLKENLVACVGLVKNRSQQGVSPKGISAQFRLNFGGSPAGVITSTRPGGKIGRNQQLDRLYVDRDSLGASLHANGINDICMVEVFSGSRAAPAIRGNGASP